MLICKSQPHDLSSLARILLRDSEAKPQSKDRYTTTPSRYSAGFLTVLRSILLSYNSP
jgi:hypothetical protein